MRILIATSHRSLVGGTEKYLQGLVPGLIQNDHQVSLLYEFRYDPRDEDVISEASLAASWCLDELGVERTLGAVDDWRPDLVYAHGLQNGRLEQELAERYSTILYAHNYYGTCISGRKCHSVPRLEPCANRFGIQCLFLYYPRRCGGLNPATMWQLFQEQSARRERLSKYRAVLVASGYMYDELLDHGVSSERLHIVPLPLPEMNNSDPIVRAPRRDRILFLGRLIDVKGAHNLIHAVKVASKRLERPLSLTVAGDGPERERLHALADQIGVSATFPGWTSGEQKRDLMEQTDLLAAPSMWPEPFGLVGIEAGQWGIPAVGYAVGGIPDWLVPGETGELAPGNPPTVDGLAQAIVRALADAQHYAKLCDGARRSAMQFRLEDHLSKLESILRQTATQAAPAAV